MFTGAENGTNSSVIHSPLAVARPRPTTVPSGSCTSTGNDASKYHTPRASPVTMNSLKTVAPGNGSVTFTFSVTNGELLLAGFGSATSTAPSTTTARRTAIAMMLFFSMVAIISSLQLRNYFRYLRRIMAGDVGFREIIPCYDLLGEFREFVVALNGELFFLLICGNELRVHLGRVAYCIVEFLKAAVGEMFASHLRSFESMCLSPLAHEIRHNNFHSFAFPECVRNSIDKKIRNY